MCVCVYILYIYIYDDTLCIYDVNVRVCVCVCVCVKCVYITDSYSAVDVAHAFSAVTLGHTDVLHYFLDRQIIPINIKDVSFDPIFPLFSFPLPLLFTLLCSILFISLN